MRKIKFLHRQMLIFHQLRVLPRLLLIKTNGISTTIRKIQGIPSTITAMEMAKIIMAKVIIPTMIINPIKIGPEINQVHTKRNPFKKSRAKRQSKIQVMTTIQSH